MNDKYFLEEDQIRDLKGNFVAELADEKAENEKLRKERDELAKFIMGEGKRSECYPLAKRIIENGNA